MDDTEARALLARGFPRRSAEEWRLGLARAASTQARAGDWPLGFVMERQGRAEGVILTFATRRPGRAEPIVNLSSWFVEETARAAAPMMLMQVLRRPGALFTDLTPSAPVAAMLPRLGFTVWTEGIMAIPTPIAALKMSPARILDWPEARGRLGEDTGSILDDHAGFGCRSLVIATDTREVPVVLARRIVRGMPTSHLVYAEDRRFVLDHIGALARFLLPRGKAMIAVDIREDERIGGSAFKPLDHKRHLRGPGASSGVDFAYSELVYFPWD